MSALAHGIGTRTDLPVPLLLALLGAGAAVLASFLVAAVLWRRPRLGGRGAGRPLPIAAQQVLDGHWPRMIGRGITLALAVLVVVVALTGPPGTQNLAPWAFYVTFWVGLVPASLLLGPVWRVVNPLRVLYRLLARFTGPAPGAGRLDALGLWPAAGSLLVFLWLELVHPDRTDPLVVGVFLVSYTAANLLAALWFGEGWFGRGDGFEVYSELVARLSVWGRRDDGRLVVRNPLSNAATTPRVRGLPAVVLVLLGSTAFDGLTRTEYWSTGPGQDGDVLSGTLGLLGMVVVVAALYVVGAGLTGKRGAGGATDRARSYAHSVVPIVIGYTVAHYFSLLLFDGQVTWILASNPLGTEGVDLFGTYGNSIDYGVVGPDAIAYVQVGAVVLGHVLGVVLAHDHALRIGAGVRDQLALVAVMVGFTVAGLGLLFGF